MSIFAVGLSGFSGSSSIAFENILGVRDKLKMARVTTESIITDVVKHRYMFALPTRGRSYQPRVNKPMSSKPNLVNSDTTVAINSSASPIPATCHRVNLNLVKETTDSLWGDFHTPILPHRQTSAK